MTDIIEFKTKMKEIIIKRKIFNFFKISYDLQDTAFIYIFGYISINPAPGTRL